MSRGSSGRVVIDVGTELKRDLYSVLAKEGITLKDWFIQSASRYLEQHSGSLTKRPVQAQRNGGKQSR